MTNDSIIAFIVCSYNRADITIGTALDRILKLPIPDEDKLLGVRMVTATVLQDEKFEAEQADDEAQHQISIMKHGPHGKRCYCDDCVNPDDYEPDALAEEQSLLFRGYNTAHVVEFIKHYDL